MAPAEALAAECILAGLYLAALGRLRSGWLLYAWHVGIRRRGDWSPAALESGDAQ
jgi:hypothetical protein